MTTVEHRHLKNYCIIDFMQSNINFYGSAKNIVGQYFLALPNLGKPMGDCTIAQAVETGNWRKVHLCITTQMLICMPFF